MVWGRVTFCRATHITWVSAQGFLTIRSRPNSKANGLAMLKHLFPEQTFDILLIGFDVKIRSKNLIRVRTVYWSNSDQKPPYSLIKNFDRGIWRFLIGVWPIYRSNCIPNTFQIFLSNTYQIRSVCLVRSLYLITEVNQHRDSQYLDGWPPYGFVFILSPRKLLNSCWLPVLYHIVRQWSILAVILFEGAFS
jgi:hypothetical protein